MLVTGTILNSYHLGTPKTDVTVDGKTQQLPKPRYEILIGFDKPASEIVQAAMNAVREAGIKLSETDMLEDGHAISDGDTGRASDYDSNSGRIVVRAHSSRQVPMFTKSAQATMDSGIFYPGSVATVDINFSAKNPMKVVTCYINAIRFVRDGEPIATGGFDKGILEDAPKVEAPKATGQRLTKEELQAQLAALDD